MNVPILDVSKEIPLLSTKLYIPPVRPGQVPRPRLVERLDGSLDRKLVLISAPAGFGKTTLLAEWVEHLQSRQAAAVAWYSLDESDNDPALFAAYLAAALQNAGLLPAGMQARTQGPGASPSHQSPAQEHFMTGLLNEISTLAHALVLILDDYHLVTARPIHQAVGYLLAHLPENAVIVLATRADPPLSLARLRAQGQLVELRQTDLRFTAGEAADFLNRALGAELSAGDVAALEARTEGWIAGLQMAALALQPLARGQGLLAATYGTQPAPGPRRGPGLAASIKAFTGSHRYVLDYLVEEVLEQQPPATQEFLLRTSILKRLSSPLCDAILEAGTWQPPDETQPGQSPSQALLEQLDQANLFILPLDGERRWYRYHRLFADLLQKRLRHIYPDLVPDLHRRAGAWCQEHGLTAEAIDHTLSAEDMDHAAGLIEGEAEKALMRSEVITLLGWIEQLPDAQVRARPSLCAYHAWALLLSGRPWEQVEARLLDIDCPGDGEGGSGKAPPAVTVLRAHVALIQGDIPRAAHLSRQALARLQKDDHFLRSITQWNLAISTMIDGDAAGGRQILEQVARQSHRTGNVMVAVMILCNLAESHMKQGQLHQARQVYQQALETATDALGQQLPIAGEALIGLGELARRWGKLEQAGQYVQEGIELIELWGKIGDIEGNIGLSRIKQSLGDMEAAQQLMDEARQLAIQYDATELDDMIVDLQQVRLWIAQGNLAAARRQIEESGMGQEQDPAGLSERDAIIRTHMLKYEQVVLARLLLAQGEPGQALAVLEPMVARMEERGRHDLAIEGLVLMALAYQALHDTDQALQAIVQALTLAEPGGYVQVFLEEGQPMARLLQQAASLSASPRYTGELLAVFTKPGIGEPAGHAPGPRPQPLIDPLSERELDVLRLLATGMSNPEIADQLYVAVSTVRSHLKSIYSKLGVHRRWDAVQRAQELDLI